MGAPASSACQSNAHAPVVVSAADLQDEPPPPAGRREDRGCRHVSAPAHGTLRRSRFVPPAPGARCRGPTRSGAPSATLEAPRPSGPEPRPSGKESPCVAASSTIPRTWSPKRSKDSCSAIRCSSSGGSGHEPLHAGCVGAGMLDVAVAGAVFASPPALQVLEATKAADAGRGVVQIVKNYTGDVLNFRIAGEICGDDAIATEMVL